MTGYFYDDKGDIYTHTLMAVYKKRRKKKKVRIKEQKRREKHPCESRVNVVKAGHKNSSVSPWALDARLVFAGESIVKWEEEWRGERERQVKMYLVVTLVYSAWSQVNWSGGKATNLHCTLLQKCLCTSIGFSRVHTHTEKQGYFINRNHLSVCSAAAESPLYSVTHPQLRKDITASVTQSERQWVTRLTQSVRGRRPSHHQEQDVCVRERERDTHSWICDSKSCTLTLTHVSEERYSYGCRNHEYTRHRRLTWKKRREKAQWKSYTVQLTHKRAKMRERERMKKKRKSRHEASRAVERTFVTAIQIDQYALQASDTRSMARTSRKRKEKEEREEEEEETSMICLFFLPRSLSLSLFHKYSVNVCCTRG